MKKLLIILGAIALSMTVVRCSSGSNSSVPLTTAGKMSTGLGSAVATIQKVGGAMGSNGTFARGANNVDSLAAATKCTSHGEAGADGYNGGTVDGVVSDNEKYPQSDIHYSLQTLYCALAADTSGPESVSGSVKLMKTVICAVEKQIGSLAFDGVAVPITGITLDTTCATQAQIDGMTGTSGQSSVTLAIAGGATVTSALNPTFAEIGANGYYSQGVRIASNTVDVLKFIVVAKFDSAVSGDPVDSGNFEFATYGAGTMMQGTGVEYSAGKISGGAVTTRHLWYESRVNRIKNHATTDPVCGLGDAASSSCGFARHTRISTDISFSGADISNVSNLTAIITDAGDSTGSTQSNHITLITATGNLASGLTSKLWSKAVSPITLTVGSTIGTTFAGGEIGATTCIMSAGSSVTTSCGGGPAALSPTSGVMSTFFRPANSTTWLINAASASHNGIGFTGAATFADEQFAF